MTEWDDSAIPIMWLILGLFLLLLLLSFILLIVKAHVKHIRSKDQEKHHLQMANQKALLKVSLETEERERKRIAHLLHDDLVSQLYRVKLLSKDKAISTLLTDGIKTARNISHELTPPLLNELSIDELMIDFLYPYHDTYHIGFNYHSKEKNALSNSTKLHLLRIFQQLIINIDQHAQATEIDVKLRLSPRYVCLSVYDNGIGYDAQSKHGLGLKSIKSRVQVLNGYHRIKKTQKGTLFNFITKQEMSKAS